MAEAEKKNLFLIYHENRHDAAHYELEVRKIKDAQVERVGSEAEALGRLSQARIHALICNFNRLDSVNVSFLTRAHNVSKEANFIAITSPGFDNRFGEQTKGLERLILLEKPVADATLSLLGERIILGHKIFGRRHKRFPTDQTAKIEVQTSKAVLNGHIYNMSKGGAYVELAEGELQRNETVKLTIRLEKLARDHDMMAKVTWVMPEGFIHKKFGVGLEFLNPEKS